MKKLCILFFAAIMGFGAVSAAFAAPSVFPTGVTIYDPEKAYNGYVLISVNYKDVYSKVNNKGLFDKPDFNALPPTAVAGDTNFLMDMNGNVINVWKDEGDNKKVYLLPNGNIMSVIEAQKSVIEYNWEGKEVWRFKSKLTPHHDARRLDNGNTLILCFEKTPPSFNDKITNLTTPWWGTQDRKSVHIEGDSIIEVNPEGKIVWEWNSSEHLAEYANLYMPLTPLHDWTHGNTASIIPENKWYDAGDKRFKPGNILYNPRHFDMFIIIDKDSGKVVWKLDNFKAMGGLGQPHEPVMIPKGYPGEGNVMIFDNGLFTRNGAHAAQSIVWEIEPTTQKVVWRYLPAFNGTTRFLSKYQGSAYKLPNGNVLISEDYGGRVFQVKPDPDHPDGGEIVWEYQFPSIISRTTMYPYDFTPQLKARPRPREDKVSPLDPDSWQVLPDSQRKNGQVVKLLNK